MKKPFFLFLTLALALLCTGQTKKETEDWLTFYLNKFHGRPTNTVNGQAYIDSYSFTGHTIVQSTFNVLGDSASWKVMYIDLSKVVKVEIFVDSNTSNIQNVPCLKIWLYFQSPRFGGDTPPITMQDMNSGRRLHYDYTDLYELDFGDWEILENKMPERFKKAVEHLVTLNGGPLVKDVF